MGPLLAQADAAGTLARDAIVAYFARDPAALPLSISDAVSDDMRAAFGETMADRVIARFGAYVPANASDTGLRARLQAPEGITTLAWALLQPVTGRRQVSLRLDLLADAQAQAARAGIDSVVHRNTLMSATALGRTRITALCNLPTPRSGVDALGVNLEFPPSLPYRPEPRSATLTFEPPDDMASAEVALAPGERACYR